MSLVLEALQGYLPEALQGNLEENFTGLSRKRPPLDSTAGLCLGPYGGPRVSYERSTPVREPSSNHTVWWTKGAASDCG